jgi:hypothetical protein
MRDQLYTEEGSSFLSGELSYLVKKRKFFTPTHSQQDVNLYNSFISAKCSTCLRRNLRPSSGAENCTYSIGFFFKLMLLPAANVEQLE